MNKSLLYTKGKVVLSCNLQGKIIDMNKVGLRVFQYSKKEVIGLSVKKIFLKESFAVISKSLKKYHSYSGIILNRKKDGETFLSHIQIFPDYSRSKKLSGYTVYSRDVTAHESETLYKTDRESRYHSLFNDAKVGIARVDILTGKFLESNDCVCNLLGFKKHQVLQKQIQDVFFYSETNLPVEVSSLMKNDFSEYYCKRVKTEIRHLEIFSSIVHSEKQTPLYLLLVLHDVTEMKNRKTEILVQNAKLKAVFQSPSHIIWTLNKKWEITSYNNNFFAELSGKEKNALSLSGGKKIVIGKKMPSFFFWKKKYDEAFSGISQHFEFNLQLGQNKSQWREAYLEPIMNAEGSVLEVMGIAHDITQKKKNEQELQRALQEKEVLLREIHHRVKNNMQVISSILNLQTGFIKEEKMIKILQECQSRINSMAFVHENLYMSHNFSEVNAKDYLSSIAKSLFHSHRPAQKIIRLQLDLDNIVLDLDHSIPCGLIVNELMSNALKYAFEKTTVGKLTLSLRKKGDLVCLEISDNGCGIPKEINYKKPATLGLQLVSTLTEQIGAELVLNTKRGTSFLITFTQPIKR